MPRCAMFAVTLPGVTPLLASSPSSHQRRTMSADSAGLNAHHTIVIGSTFTNIGGNYV